MVLRPKAPDRILENLSSAKNAKLEYVFISQRNSKNL
jgi:hypothetical protein